MLGGGTFPWVRRQWKHTRPGSLGCLNFALPKDIFVFHLRGRTLLSVLSGVSDRASPPVTYSQCFQLDQSQEQAVQNSFCHTLPFRPASQQKHPRPLVSGERMTVETSRRCTQESGRLTSSQQGEKLRKESKKLLGRTPPTRFRSRLLPLSGGPHPYGFRRIKAQTPPAFWVPSSRETLAGTCSSRQFISIWSK